MGGDPLRRLVDLAVSSAGLLVLSPLLLAIGGLVKLDSRGPMLYAARRVGKDGRVFRLYKFRSMVATADREGPGITAAGDRRITAVGRVLRRTKLDELPQLINVLLGDMSLVGPRPEDPRYVAYYTPAEREVLRVLPGITSAASLTYRDESSLLSGAGWEDRYIHEILPHKLAIELEYLGHRTLGRDLGLIARTVLAMFRR